MHCRHNDESIVTAGNNALPVGGDRDHRHGTLMGGEMADLFTGGDVPEPHGPVFASRDGLGAVGR